MTDTVPTKTLYEKRHTISLTQEMDEKMTQLLAKQGRSVSFNDLVRIALRQYIDDQEDQIGSRRHFSKSLQNRLDQLEGKLLFYLQVIIFLIAGNLAVIVQAVTKDPNIQSTDLIRRAIKITFTEGPKLNKQLDAVLEEINAE